MDSRTGSVAPLGRARRHARAACFAVGAVALWIVAEAGEIAPEIEVLARIDADVHAWSPDGSRLAYFDRNGLWIVAAPEFRMPQPVVRKQRGAGGSYPVPTIRWSPDGRRLAFSDARPGDGWSSIWVVGADGFGLRELLPPGTPFNVPGIRALTLDRWLNGTGISFLQHCGTGCVALNTAAVSERRFGTLCVAGEANFHWDRSGQKVLAASLNSPYWSWLGLAERTQPVPGPEAVDSGCRTLLEGRCELDQPGEIFAFLGWAADGERLLYRSRLCGTAVEGTPTLEAMAEIGHWDPGAGQRSPLAHGVLDAALSPDGSRLAVLRPTMRGGPGISIAVIATDGGDVNDQTVLSGGAGELVVDGSSPFVSWSPSSQAVAVVAAAGLLGVLGLERAWLLEPAPLGLSLDWAGWSPDGRWLVLRDPRGDLVLLRVRDLESRRITDGLAADIHFSPGGEWALLWPHARREASVEEPRGLERFLPPAGRDQWALSEAALIDGHFEALLAAGPRVNETYSFHAIEYALSLEIRGELDAAQRVYREAIERIQALPLEAQAGRIEPIGRALARFRRCNQAVAEGATAEQRSRSAAALDSCTRTRPPQAAESRVPASYLIRLPRAD